MPAVWIAAACTPASISDLSRLLQVIGQFLSLSLFSLGGGNTLLAEYQIASSPTSTPWQRPHRGPVR
jgi:chromate transporter